MSDQTDFERLMEKRLAEVERQLRLLSNVSRYKHEPAFEREDMIDDMADRVEASVAKLMDSFGLEAEVGESDGKVSSASPADSPKGTTEAERKTQTADSEVPKDAKTQIIGDLKWAFDAIVYDKKMAGELILKSIGVIEERIVVTEGSVRSSKVSRGNSA